MKAVVYTAIFGNYDKLKRPKHINKEFDYICFTDKKKRKKPWKIHLVKPEFENLRKENRKYKILAHEYLENYDYSIYIDGHVRIIGNVYNKFIDWLGNNDIAVFKHPRRDCIYQEALACLDRKIEEKKVVEELIDRLEKENYPLNNGLTLGGILIRKHCKEIEEFNDLWWNEVNKYSLRDQLSFYYVVNKLKMAISLIPPPNPSLKKDGKNQYFKIGIHGPKILYLKYLIQSLWKNFKLRLKQIKR